MGSTLAVPRLFIIDGAKALMLQGDPAQLPGMPHATIQRCQNPPRKARNIMERLSPCPACLRSGARYAQAWELDDADKAEKLICNLAPASWSA